MNRPLKDRQVRGVRKRDLKTLVLTVIWLFITYLCWLFSKQIAEKIPQYIYLSGWLLFATMIFLTLYNMRKKLSFLPLLSAKLWLNCHLYVGLACILLFLIHSRFTLPRGSFEWILAVLFWLVVGSGCYGWLLCNVFPRRMRSHGGEVLYEKIPEARAHLQQQAEELAKQSILLGKERLIADLYRTTLHPFFAKRSIGWKDLCLESQGRVNRLLNSLQEVYRYTTSEEQEILQQFQQLVLSKQALEKQQFYQRSLRYWLFLHIPFTYSLLVCTLLHILLVLAFAGGVQ